MTFMVLILYLQHIEILTNKLTPQSKSPSQKLIVA
jgi:hypothetical protein